MCGNSFVVSKAGTDGQTEFSPSIGPVGVKNRIKESEHWKYIDWMEHPCELVLLSMAGNIHD